MLLPPSATRNLEEAPSKGVDGAEAAVAEDTTPDAEEDGAGFELLHRP